MSEDEELPPLVPIEEADLPLIRASSEGETQAAPSVRPSRQLKNRSVARSVIKDRRVKFSSLVDYIDGDHRFQQTSDLDKEGTLFPPDELQGDINYMSRERWELLYDRSIKSVEKNEATS